MEVFSLVTLTTLVAKVMSFVKYLTGAQYREAGTQALTWLAGVLVVVVASAADVTQDLVIFGEMVLEDLSGLSQILAGLSLSSTASFAYDFKKALDNSDSASEPPLGGSAP